MNFKFCFIREVDKGYELCSKCSDFVAVRVSSAKVAEARIILKLMELYAEIWDYEMSKHNSEEKAFMGVIHFFESYLYKGSKIDR